MTINDTPRLKHVQLYLILIPAIFLFSGLIINFSNWSYDDPFITYRYARNLSQGNGFVYNHGVRLLSTTTPLYALLLTGFEYISDHIPLVANIIGMTSLVAGGMIIWLIGDTWEEPFVAWTGLLVYPTFALAISPLGSETPLYLVFCLGTYLAYIHHRYLLTAVLAGLAVLTRTDAVLIPMILGLDFFIRKVIPALRNMNSQKVLSKIPWVPILVFLALVGTWHIFAWLYFGSPFPVTLTAKQLQGEMAISQLFAPGIVRIVGWYTGSWQNWALFLMVVLGYLKVIRADRKWWIIVTWPLLYFAAYSFLGVTSYFWYYTPLVPGLIVAAGLGFSGAHDLLRNAFSRLKLNGSRISMFAVLGIILLIGLIQFLRLPNIAASADQRHGIYRAAGEWLNENTLPNESAGALEVGIIGYYSQRTMVDFAGLLQPDVAEVMSVDTTYSDTSIYAIDEYHPDFVVMIAGTFPDVEQFLADRGCAVRQTLSGQEYQANFDLDIYACPW